MMKARSLLAETLMAALLAVPSLAQIAPKEREGSVPQLH